jgi:hypothetical protein
MRWPKLIELEGKGLYQLFLGSMVIDAEFDMDDHCSIPATVIRRILVYLSQCIPNCWTFAPYPKSTYPAWLYSHP